MPFTLLPLLVSGLCIYPAAWDLLIVNYYFHYFSFTL